MNPFTRFLMGRRPKEDYVLRAFVERWDALEALVIRVFRAKGAEAADETEYRELLPWLLINYPSWQEEWRPYWQAAKAGDQPVKQDPFQRILSAEKAADFATDWEAMQYLPAAREALNRYIQEVIR